MQIAALLAHRDDNTATVIKNVHQDDIIVFQLGEVKVEIIARSDIPLFHKVALKDILSGQNVIKYGEVIGVATTDICKGDYVHIHNVESKRGRGDWQRKGQGEQ